MSYFTIMLAIELSVVLRDSEYIFALPSSCNSFVVITRLSTLHRMKQIYWKLHCKK